VRVRRTIFWEVRPLDDLLEQLEQRLATLKAEIAEINGDPLNDD
jgi:hypothetical protein